MANVSVSDLMHLTIPERIQLAADLWDSVAAETDALPVTEAQRREVLRRSKAHRDNPEEATPMEEALERIERSLD